MNRNDTLKVGIMPLDEYKARTMAIVRGELKPNKNDPKIWFPSIKSLASVLSEENQALLKLITEREPKSIREIEIMTTRKSNNILRTLRTLENYGFVKLIEGKKGSRGRVPLIPKVLYRAAQIEVFF